jgi:hypothetical protein
MIKTKKSSSPIKPRPQFTFRQWILALVFAAIILFGLHFSGVVNIPFFDTFNFGFQNTKNLHVNEMTIGVPYAIDFGPSSLIPLLPQESTGGPYTFYLGSGVGFPPMGLILGIDGVLRGTPTTAGNSEFQVCVKDVGGRSACKTYQFTVNSRTNNTVVPVKNTTKQPTKTCPTTSCDTGECCGAAIGSGMGATMTTHVLVDKSCGCPSDTILSLDQDQASWKLYNLKNCDCNTNH